MIYPKQFCLAVCDWEYDFPPFLDVINTFLKYHIQICMSRPRNINVFQWNRECFFSKKPLYCNLGSRADIEISVLREVSKNAVLTRHHFCSGRSCDKFPCTSTTTSHPYGFSLSAGPCDKFTCTSSLVLSLLVDAGYSVDVTVPLFQQSHSSHTDEVWKHDDSKKDLHKTCQIPTNCQCK